MNNNFFMNVLQSISCGTGIYMKQNTEEYKYTE